MKTKDTEVKKLSTLNVNKYVRKASGACEENVKIKIVIPLLNLLGYSIEHDMDFEHHVRNKRADIALLLNDKPKLLVETKDLDKNLDKHVDQALHYAYGEGVEWVILTNGIETRIYKSFIPGISEPKDRLLFSTQLTDLPKSFSSLQQLVSKQNLGKAKQLGEKAESIRENITAQLLISDLAECRDRLFDDLFKQFKARYKKDKAFKELLDAWAENVKMDISDPEMVNKLCREGAYTLINRVIFLRICEDKGHIKPKLSKDSISKWREMVEKPSNLLSIAFTEIGERSEGLYKSPLFDSIKFEDVNWNSDTIHFVLDKLGEHDFSLISKDILGLAYERHISSEERKNLGQFYTPDVVIDYILDRMDISPDNKILDPACGSGGFLIRAYDRLRTQYESEEYDRDVIHGEILRDNLFGIDINPFATQLTVMNLLLKDLNHPSGEINVVEGDTLEKLEGKFDFDLYEVNHPLAYIENTNKKLTYSRMLKNRPFDIVVGNPPYVSFGLRGVGKVSEGQRKYLEANYTSAEYKISMYAVFIERGLELLKQHGKFGFIVPDSFLLGRYFSRLRTYILNTCKILEIVLFDKDFWEYGVVGRPVIIVLEKETDKQLRASNKLTARYCYTLADKNHLHYQSYSYSQKYFNSKTDNLKRFRLFFNAKSKNLVETIEKNSLSLGKIVNFASGLIGKEGKDSIVNNKRTSAKWFPGLVSGKEVQRYAINRSGHFILWDIPKLHSGFKEAIYNVPKIFMRQTGDTIIAAYDDNNLLCLNNLHVGNLIKENYYLKYILACLNSKLLNHYYHLISLEFGRTMAQTDIETVESFPIKQATKPQQKKIVRLVDKIAELSKEYYECDDNDKANLLEKRINQVDADIDQEICDLYGIDINKISDN